MTKPIELLAQIDEPAPPAPRPPSADVTGLALVVQRLAENPQVDVVKLEKIIELQERILRHHAESAFNTAFAAMLPDIPTIIERARTDKTSYAPLEDIVEPLRPVLAKHGFSLSFRTEWPSQTLVRVVGILTHTAGHSRQSEFLSAADPSGSKNAIQALASAISYGKRYTAKDLLCIVTRGEDDDGEASDNGRAPQAPDGYDAWWTDMVACADEGWPRLSMAWADTKNASFRNYTVGPNKANWAALKAKAQKVQK